MAEQAAPLPAGVMVADRYQVVRRLVTGGMGAIYEVIDQQTNRRRALKLMLPDVAEDPDLGLRFTQEATVAGRVESDHIVEIFDAGTDAASGAPFLVMELLRGADLATELAQQGRLDAERAVAWLSQLASGLDKVHAEGIVHRDLKPENVFVSRRDDGTARLKILDFGIAKVVSGTGSMRTTRALGTPLFMAPEQLKGDGAIDPRADLYSLAHVAYMLLTGAAYWQPEYEQSLSVYRFIMLVVDGVPESAAERAARHGVQLPEAFADWFAKASATHPEDRFATASEQILALADALDQTAAARVLHATAPTHSIPPAPSLPPPARTTAAVSRVATRKAGSKPWALGAAVVVAVIAVWAIGRRSPVAAAPPPVVPAQPAPSASAPPQPSLAEPAVELPAPSSIASAPPAPPAPEPAPRHVLRSRPAKARPAPVPSASSASPVHKTKPYDPLDDL